MVLSRLLSIEITTMLLVAFVIFSAIGLTISHKILVKKGKEVLTWQLYGGLYFAAMLAADFPAI